MPKRKITVSVSCCGVGCYDQAGGYIPPEELEAIGNVFLEGARFLRAKAYGEVHCIVRGQELASVMIDHQDREFDQVSGLPVLKRIPVRKARK
jgi:hypothetical protein